MSTDEENAVHVARNASARIVKPFVNQKVENGEKQKPQQHQHSMLVSNILNLLTYCLLIIISSVFSLFGVMVTGGSLFFLAPPRSRQRQKDVQLTCPRVFSRMGCPGRRSGQWSFPWTRTRGSSRTATIVTHCRWLCIHIHVRMGRTRTLAICLRLLCAHEKYITLANVDQKIILRPNEETQIKYLPMCFIFEFRQIVIIKMPRFV